MSGATYHFHVSRAARARYGLSRSLFSTSGNVVLLDLHAARLLAQRINAERARAGTEPAVRAGDLNAMGLIDEILHYVVGLYRKRVNPRVSADALAFVRERVGASGADDALARFVDAFTPPDGTTAPAPEITLEEMLLLSLANADPAFQPFVELFDHAPLDGTRYPEVMAALEEFFRKQPVFGPDGQDLVTMLRSPVRAAPTSLSGQLEYIRTRWGDLLGDLLLRLLTGIDLIHEEEKMRFGGFTPGPPEVYEYAGQVGETEAFSADRDWMPRTVMMAKNALVWLDQLSRAYGGEIRRLDQVPDAELDRLARAGFTALWLIGVWERSAASREIKHRMGNPDAEASAYSLFDYVVADELGGQPALDSLKERAARRGIRMASDMVPNHTGVDSRWMAEHPERFLRWPHPWPPFPSYSFNGPDVSRTQGLGVRLEDHYWDKTDAAVVFTRVDRGTGEERFIYHGNDGTHMPWNDTAQLDFLNPETREAVIRTILHVARSFPIIRFDAAMTLTKKHFQRLWFPEPGRGGDIPSRAGNGMSRHDFDAAMPREFWREVVDRVAAEAPDTLLLAEAFWLLEGFFVRTLGMHRVYNSAFMHMLKAEDNGGYRLTVKNTLEFDPEVLKRFVNFMSNPDEQTAIEQFGDGDKYFGVCTLMATLPGLPMFAHGQLEGLKEKYGMEFRRAYWEERTNDALVARHEREIYPLLRRRHLFAGVQGFLFYDFWTPGGGVNEDVFAYSNRSGDERGLVLYNNRYADTRGWVKTSVAFSRKTDTGRSLAQQCLGEGLALPNDPGAWCIFRGHPSGLQYMRNCRELWEQGLYAELGAYACQVYLDFFVVRDDARGRWAGLAAELAGRGVPSVDTALRERELRPVRDPFARILSADPAAPVGELGVLYGDFLRAVAAFSRAALDEKAILKDFTRRRAAVATGGTRSPPKRAAVAAPGSAKKQAPSPTSEAAAAFHWLWRVIRPLCGKDGSGGAALAWIDEWMFVPLIRDFLVQRGWATREAEAAPALLALTLRAEVVAARDAAPAAKSRTARSALRAWKELLADPSAELFLDVHVFDGVRWCGKEALESLTACVAAVLRADGLGAPDGRPLLKAAEKAGYRWEELLAGL
jgi:glycosidase